MVQLSQGDIFGALEERADLAIVFGYLGFNFMHSDWDAFRDRYPGARLPSDPFLACPRKSLPIPPRRFLWFVPVGGVRGLSDEEITEELREALQWASHAGLKRIITNGVHDTLRGHDPMEKRDNDDRRGRMLLGWSSEAEARLGLTIELISRNDVFVRIPTPPLL